MDFHIIHPIFAANFTFSHKKLSQQAKINIRNHKIRKTILNKESHIKPEELPAGWQNAYSMIYFHINGEKRIYESGTVFCNDPWDLPSEAIFIMDMSGSSLCPPDVDMLLNGAY